MRTFCFFCLLTLFACHSSPPPPPPSTPSLDPSPVVDVQTWQDTPWVEIDTFGRADSIQVRKTYAAVRASIHRQRVQFAQGYRNAASQAAKDSVLQEARKYLLKAIPGELLPPWYGTPWDFNGHTNHPREGLIACGYFVSTPLKHIGWPINRYWVAQQAASVIIDTLCEQRWTFSQPEAAISHILGRPDDLYLVGLSNHVGFLLVENGKGFFLHATYVSPSIAFREPVETSPVFHYSDIYVIGTPLDIQGILREWVRTG
ncbi:MAG: hypothetical protein AAF399_00710 [Bacteroidota bacterium]